MPSLKFAALAFLAATASALPAVPGNKWIKRQAQNGTATPPTGGTTGKLTDPDILQFALTLEHLEEAFYRQGFAKFPDSDFAALGLKENQIKDLKGIGQTEQEHVTFLQSAIAQAGVQPVQPCEYDFKFTDAAGMATQGALLENIGVSAYLGAAKLIKDPDILTAAGSILTIESRHQSSLRVLLGQTAVPQAFDAPLGPKAVFSLAAPFIKSCPEGSNLALSAFPELTMSPESNAREMTVGSMLKVAAGAGAAGAKSCAFTSGGVLPGGTMFTPFSETEGCQIPQGVAGVTYLSLASSSPLDGVLTDGITVAGPMILGL
ncbi:Ferritin/ribonucleotide reductase-like protein [Metarhizium rileyi]|uniref:Ferritin/ribonucleotide reductase-like protein n=1 Tax=Metarhizium rileyi (strain RCEF 4871) TaxID=1649241 RepID=A0A167BEE0_METRR|nr:Ferritin/ribonucleotide reductase-like protein [Metarhizium rileyi RCEF 4871]TWU72299.1 hypothetical protein ED733_003808 [Metarhizium rileyi]